jgi:hypothetical protein
VNNCVTAGSCAAACASSERISFRQINRKTGNRLRQQLIDEETRDPVDAHDNGRGYEIGKGQFHNNNMRNAPRFAVSHKQRTPQPTPPQPENSAAWAPALSSKLLHESGFDLVQQFRKLFCPSPCGSILIDCARTLVRPGQLLTPIQGSSVLGTQYRPVLFNEVA